MRLSNLSWLGWASPPKPRELEPWEQQLLAQVQHDLSDIHDLMCVALDRELHRPRREPASEEMPTKGAE
jgi:hypothetical protein